ncbi:MAG: hypothetical protein U1F43_24925 [Myxococcota bacterium]
MSFDRLACALAAVAAVAASGLAGCARDPAQVSWDDAFDAALREPPRQRSAAMHALAQSAPRVTDRGEADFESAMALVEAARASGEPPLEAARAWADLTQRGARRVDRARAHYQLGRIAEETGHLADAEAIDKACVLHFPDLMPGERSLAHLVRRARERGDAAMDALLDWLVAEPVVLDGPLADNVRYLEADEAERRFRRDRDPRLGLEAQRLYRAMADAYPESPLWNDALWNLSILYHEAGRFDDEIAAIRRIQRSRVAVSLFGQNEHEYYWKGQLRIARVQWLDLHRPRDAAQSYLDYRTMYPFTIRHDDMLFYAGCALRAAGASPEALWDELRKEFPDSKFVRRLPTPNERQCLPPEGS